MRIALLEGIADTKAAAALFREIWQAGEAEQPVSGDLMRALAHAGNYVAGVYDGTTLIAAAMGFRGAAGLHSHITGVDPRYQGRGVGLALKMHQREWALEQGLNTISWTFDPLVRRNAYFNLIRLGASVTSYLVDFYGSMADGINAGQPSDRLYVTWDLTVVGGQPAEGKILVAIPEDIEKLRSTDPALAQEWRFTVRDALTDERYRIIGLSRTGSYVLEEKA